jgi:mannose-6-phosphate isomerase-like protein (cupin superfamily)
LACPLHLVEREQTMRSTFMRFGHGFRVVLGNRRAQVAAMVLDPGDAEGGPRNRHRGADQWLYVVAGSGVAVVNGRRRRLRAGSLLLIERGDEHEVRNTGRAALRTLNLYVPPAYRRDGNELPAGRG